MCHGGNMVISVLMATRLMDTSANKIWDSVNKGVRQMQEDNMRREKLTLYSVNGRISKPNTLQRRRLRRRNRRE